MDFFINDLSFGYHFKVWDISSRGISLLVNEDCDLVNYLKVGDILNLKYQTTDSSLERLVACVRDRVDQADSSSI